MKHFQLIHAIQNATQSHTNITILRRTIMVCETPAEELAEIDSDEKQLRIELDEEIAELGRVIYYANSPKGTVPEIRERIDQITMALAIREVRFRNSMDELLPCPGFGRQTTVDSRMMTR